MDLLFKRDFRRPRPATTNIGRYHTVSAYWDRCTRFRTSQDEDPPNRMSQNTRIKIIALCSALIAALAVAAAASSMAATPTAPRGWKPGWLVRPPAYIGRYTLLSSTSRGARNAHVSGALTLFMQRAYASKPPIPSGIISLRSRRYDVVLYLTDLDHDGATRVSLVHGGAFVAPATGTFTLSKLAGGKILGTLRQKGLGTQTLSFKRVSTSPQP